MLLSHFRSICLGCAQEGDRFWRMAEAYVRGNTIKYVRVPPEVRTGPPSDTEWRLMPREPILTMVLCRSLTRCRKMRTGEMVRNSFKPALVPSGVRSDMILQLVSACSCLFPALSCITAEERLMVGRQAASIWQRARPRAGRRARSRRRWWPRAGPVAGTRRHGPR